MKINVNEHFTITEIEATADELRANRSLGESLASALARVFSNISDVPDDDTEDAEANGAEESKDDQN